VRVPRLPDCLPRRGNAFSSALSRALLGAWGWRIDGDFPPRAKMVAIVAPHTSNWDFIVGILAVFAIGIRVRFLAKHTLFKPWLGWLMRWFGGMPVNREAPQGRHVAHCAERRRDVLDQRPDVGPLRASDRQRQPWPPVLVEHQRVDDDAPRRAVDLDDIEHGCRVDHGSNSSLVREKARRGGRTR